MEFATYDDVTDFLDVAGSLYESDPVRHTIALTVLRQLATAPPSGARKPLLITIHDNHKVIGAAFRTPPWPIGVSGVPEHAIPDLVEFLVDGGYTVNGVNGPRPEADRFAEVWVSATGQTSTQGMAQRLYRLGTLQPPSVAGEWRHATEDDVPLLVRWRHGFIEDSHMLTADPDWPEGQLRRDLAAGSAHGIWSVSGEPVSYAAASVPRSGMSRVGSVYTPREHRGHGYGSAVTAAASQWALDNGASDVVLFTDLSNPTSNAIYQKLGYVPVLDAIYHHFHQARSGGVRDAQLGEPARRDGDEAVERASAGFDRNESQVVEPVEFFLQPQRDGARLGAVRAAPAISSRSTPATGVVQQASLSDVVQSF